MSEAVQGPAQLPGDSVKPAPHTGNQPKPKLGALGVLLFQANFGWMFASGISGTLLPALMEQVDASAKVALYGTLSSIGGLTGLVANIVFGSVSDRTRSRWGRRNPWILGGGLLAGLSLAAMSLATAFPTLVLLFVAYEIGLNMLLAPLAAVLPDRVHPNRRGLASTLIGCGTLLAQSLGAVVGAAFLSDIRLGLGTIPLIVCLTSALFVVFARDKSNRDQPKVELTFREVLRTFRIPLDRDYLFALFGRMLLLLAFNCVLMYKLYILQDYLHLSKAGVAGAIAISGTLMAVSAAIGTLVSGPLSDLIKRRKPLVVAASLVIGATFVPLILWPSRTTFLLFIGFAGLAYGVYIAVDQALMTDVLPNDAAHGKDMGILNIANTAPRFVTPALAALAFSTGLGYRMLFILAVALAVLSAVLIGAIRRVR